jgi:hypothetical protein
LSRHALDPAFAKIDRSKTHIRELGAAIAEFAGGSPYRLVPKLNRKGDKHTWNVVTDPIPDEIESIAHDAIHNLRTPLDKMLTAGFRASGVHNKNALIGLIAFPTGGSRKQFESALAKQEQHLSNAVTDFLNDAQPYVGGRGELLWAVNKLDNRDKHRTLLAPIKLAMRASNVSDLKVWSGQLFSLGSRRGQHLLLIPEGMPGGKGLYQPNDAARPILRTNHALVKGNYLEFAGAHDDMEVMTTSVGARIEIDLTPEMNVAFSQIDGFEGEPVVKLIWRMCEAVEATLNAFREQFF